MNRECEIIRSQSGLTMLEILMAFIIAAFLGSMLIEYLGSSMTRGGETVVMVQDAFSLQGVMEKISADYEHTYLNDDYDFDTFKTNIQNGNNSDNTPYYGDYEVDVAYIVFNAGVEAVDTSGENRVLKVTVRSGAQSLMTLFRK